MINQKELTHLVKKALDNRTIELGYTSDGPVGFIVNDLVLKDGTDLSDKADALCIDKIWYANEDDNVDLDTIEEIRHKYNNRKLSKMIAESLGAIWPDVAEEIVTHLQNSVDNKISFFPSYFCDGFSDFLHKIVGQSRELHKNLNRFTTNM